ncbi:unnamed protein product [Oppiella nova]|uniref:G-protein coupled receptors family 1 profile domain-containing protein n=1 Tax=Oppiella nova TaxID=334625 RepID=A0A7R9LIS7_9ACAR|nr:unnamed protein product [Oppiella nova]CAG2163391.1 unnamed protein product [Oppiella nova]
MNSTHVSSDELYFIQFLSSILLFIIIFTTLIGNGLVITAVITTPKLQIRPNYLILSLSITDLCVGVFVMPLYAYFGVVHISDWKYGSVMCDIYYTITVSLMDTSVLHLTFIAIDRYLSIARIQYSRNTSKRHVMAMIAFSWITPLSATTWPQYRRDSQLFLDNINQSICFPFTNNKINRLNVHVSCLIVLCIIVSMYYGVYKKSIEFKTKRKRYERHEFQRHKPEDKNDKIMRREFKVAKTAAVVTIVFAICVTPFNIIYFVSDAKTISYRHLAHWQTSLWIMYINSTLNPIIYGALNPNFCVVFKRLLKIT